MKQRKVDLVFEWIRRQPRREFHYRDDVWAALAGLHPDEFGLTDERRTPWFTIHRDMTQDSRFLRGDAGMFRLAEGLALSGATPVKVARAPDVRRPQVWIFQANPTFYRILEALQRLDRMQFLTNRYKDQVRVGDVVLIWMSGSHAGIYAQARVLEGVAERISREEDTEFWVNPTDESAARPRVVLAIERRFLGNPVLKSTITATDGLTDLLILRQPNGTNFRVEAEEWERLRTLLPTEETIEPSPVALLWAQRRARGGQLYDQSCGDLLERFVAEAFSDGEEHTKDEIEDWFTSNYPLFKPITVHCHIEKYTTNFRSRVHYNATTDHDLLYRVDDDWSRLRLYRPEDDPAPIHDRPEFPRGTKSKPSIKGSKVSPTERNRALLEHLAAHGELVRGDLEDLGLEETHLGDWLDCLLAHRPEAYVATPLFLHLIDGGGGSASFTTRLAAQLMGEHLGRHAAEPIPELEEHVWSRFGHWHLPQPSAGELQVHAYQTVPIREPRDVAASERLDLFAHLPAKVIGGLIRDAEFLTEQQSWSADAGSKGPEGPLSAQLRRIWKRPLPLRVAELLGDDDGQVLLGKMQRADVVERSYVVSGLPLCRADDWEPSATLERDTAAERLFQHPIAAAILQFEVHRLFAGLSGDASAALHVGDATTELDVDGVSRGPLWGHVRALLEQVGYWPIGASTQDSLWAECVHVMLSNLELLDVLERHGNAIQLTATYQSKIKAHPGHPQNRGEKAYRVCLSRFLATLRGGHA